MNKNCIFKETAYRLKENGTNSVRLPKIPCHPIGYAAAKILMRYAGSARVTVTNVNAFGLMFIFFIDNVYIDHASQSD